MGETRGPERTARREAARIASSRRAGGTGFSSPRYASAMRRWSVPLSLAAAVVLSVLVTLRVQHEDPDIALPTAQAPSTPVQAPSTPVQAPSTPVQAPEEKAAVARAEPMQQPSVTSQAITSKAAAPAMASQRKQAGGTEPPKPASALPDAMREAPRDESRLPKFSPDPGPVVVERRADAAPAEPPVAASSAPAAARAPAATPPPPVKPAPQGSLDMQAAGSRRAPAGIAQDQVRERAAKNEGAELAKRAEEVETPERQLERIATLRREGKHAEADKLLADFKQRYPQYRIPEATLEKVLPPR
jgi:hypothetical protein